MRAKSWQSSLGIPVSRATIRRSIVAPAEQVGECTVAAWLRIFRRVPRGSAEGLGRVKTLEGFSEVE